MMELFNHINLIYNHSFLFIRQINSHHEFSCKKCNISYYLYNSHMPGDFDAGIDFENMNYEIYRSTDPDDLDLILYDNIINCEAQIIKNLLE